MIMIKSNYICVCMQNKKREKILRRRAIIDRDSKKIDVSDKSSFF